MISWPGVEAMLHFPGNGRILGERVTSKYIFYFSCVAKTARKLPDKVFLVLVK